MKRAIAREVLSAYTAVITELQDEGFCASDFDFEELVDKTMIEIDHKKFK